MSKEDEINQGLRQLSQSLMAIHQMFLDSFHYGLSLDEAFHGL